MLKGHLEVACFLCAYYVARDRRLHVMIWWHGNDQICTPFVPLEHKLHDRKTLSLLWIKVAPASKVERCRMLSIERHPNKCTKRAQSAVKANLTFFHVCMNCLLTELGQYESCVPLSMMAALAEGGKRPMLSPLIRISLIETK